MALIKLSDYYPHGTKDLFGDHDITKFSVYATDTSDNDKDKLGSVKDLLVDETNGRFRYFIVETGFLGIGKKVLLPVGMGRFDYDKERLYVPGFNKEQADNLPEFNDDLKIDNDYEERVRTSYGSTVQRSNIDRTATPSSTYDYEREPYFYDLNDITFRSYEDRMRDRRSSQVR